MKTFRVTCMAYFNREAEIEAETAEEAIEIARTSTVDWEQTFLECDHYEAEVDDFDTETDGEEPPDKRVVIEDFDNGMRTEYGLYDESGGAVASDFKTYSEAARYAKDNGYTVVVLFSSSKNRSYLKGGTK